MFLKLKINNNDFVDLSNPIYIIDEHPILTWEIEDFNVVSIDGHDGTFEETSKSHQKSFEIRIGNSSTHLGSDSFIGNFSKVNIENSQEMYWKYHGFPISRGNTYVGQIRVTDSFDRVSDWLSFSFFYKLRPRISHLKLTPFDPVIGDNIEIQFFEEEGHNNDIFTQWYINGSYATEFDNHMTISSNNMNDNDTLMARVIVYDGYEYSKTYFTNKIILNDKKIFFSDIKILPLQPNYDDILKVEYNIDNYTHIDEDQLKVKWYINDSLNIKLNDKKFIRPNCNIGDSVRVAVSYKKDYNYKSSDYVYIHDRDFIIKDILVDGKVNPLDVSSTTPNISWKIISPQLKNPKYVSIKIGTFYEADNIYSKIFDYGIDSFTVPYNILEKGRDYFISIAASDNEFFNEYSYARIRLLGSRWELNVDNDIGWTLETFFDIKGSSEDNDDKMHTLKIHDGKNFAEINIIEDLENGNKIALISGDVIQYNIGTNKYGLLTVAGKKNDIKIYFDRELIIDGSNIFNQQTEYKKLEIGCFNNSKLQINYKYFTYTTQGYFLPGQSSEYANLKFHKFIEFKEGSIVSLNRYSGGKKIFAVNPHIKNYSSYIYTLLSDNKIRYGTTTKSFCPINKINKSLNNKYIAVGYARGLINIENYFIGSYDNELLFIDRMGIVKNQNPEDKKWELIQTTEENKFHYNEYGFNINTIGEE